MITRLAQRLYDDGEHKVSEIAEMLNVKRTTLYGRLAKSEQAQPVAG